MKTPTRPDAAAVPPATMDAAAPVPTAPTAPATTTPQQDASVAVDAATALDGSISNENTTPDCQPGDYTGEFSGELEAAGIPVSVVGGPITASLTLSADGLYLEMSDVTVFGRDVLGNTVWAAMSGRINCKTLELEEGLLERGRYYIASRRSSLSFDGVAQGAYTPSPYALRGTWSVSARIAEIITGAGEFELVRNE